MIHPPIKDPLLLDVPEQFETERLILRCPLPGDGAIVNPAVIETQEELERWLPWATYHKLLNEAEASCRRARARYMLREDFRLHVFRKDNGRFVGSTGLHRPDWENPRLELGYWCRKSEQGQGFVTESSALLVDLAFRFFKVNRLEVRCDEGNRRSQAVPKRLGIPLEGRMVHDERDHHGQLRTTLLFAKTSSPV